MSKGLMVLFATLVIAVGIFIVPLGDAADSAHSFLGGCAIVQEHKAIYRDYFSQHNPLIDDMIALLYRMEGWCDTTFPRYVFFAIFVAVLILYFIYTSPHVSFLLLLSYAILALRYSLQLPLAETLIVYTGLATVLLFWKHAHLPRLLVWTLFILTQFVYLTANPLYVPIAMVQLIFFLRETTYPPLPLLLTTGVPTLFYFLHIDIRTYLTSVGAFNIQQYPACVGGVKEIFFRYFSPIKHVYVNGIVRIIFEIGTGLWATRQALGKKTRYGLYIFTTGLLLAIRPEGFHLGPFVFFTLAILFLCEKNKMLLLVLFLLMTYLSVPVFRETITRIDMDKIRYIALINKYSSVGDYVLIYPGRPEVYVLTNRRAGSYYPIFGPCFLPDAQDRVIRDISSNNVKMVIVDNKHNAFGKGNPVDLLSRVIDYLRVNGKYDTIPVDEFITVYRRL